jgi:hypothetical protein
MKTFLFSLNDFTTDHQDSKKGVSTKQFRSPDKLDAPLQTTGLPTCAPRSPGGINRQSSLLFCP